MPRKILIVDIERGSSPVKGLPGVTVADAPTFPDVERVYWELRRQQDGKSAEFPDVVVLDTITYLADATRQELVLEEAQLRKGLWANRKEFEGDQRPAYGTMATLVQRLLMMYRGLETITMFIMHEAERPDPAGIVKRGPALNPALINPILAWSDVLAHLGKIQNDVREGGKIVIPAGTRRLRLQEDARYMAKARVPANLPTAPSVIVRPALDAFLSTVLGDSRVGRISLYGPPGVGKTTLASGGTAREEGKQVDEVATEEVKSA